MPRSTPRIVLVAAVALALGLGLALLVQRNNPVAPAKDAAPLAPTVTATPTGAQAPLATSPTATTGTATLVPDASAPKTSAGDPTAAPLLNGEAAGEAITELAVTYDAAAVPALARYLGHSDPEIRSAARDGLIQLGERAAIPFLESAAKTAPADEAKELREAAEFLALPTWTERRAEQKKAKAAAAGANATTP